MSMICPNCGAENADENRICDKCGKRLSTERIPASSNRSSKKKKSPEFSLKFLTGGSSKRKYDSSLKRNAGSSLKRNAGSSLKRNAGSYLKNKPGSLLNRRDSDPDRFEDDFDNASNVMAANVSMQDDFEYEEVTVTNSGNTQVTNAGSIDNYPLDAANGNEPLAGPKGDDVIGDASLDVSFGDDAISDDSLNGNSIDDGPIADAINADSIDDDFDIDSDDSDTETSRTPSSAESSRLSKPSRTLTFSRNSKGSKPSRTLTFSRNSKESKPTRTLTFSRNSKGSEPSRTFTFSKNSGKRDTSESDGERSSGSLKERRAASMKRKRQKRIMRIRIAVIISSILLLIVAFFSIKRSVNNYIQKKEQMRYDELHATIDMVTLSPEEQDRVTQQKRMYEKAVDDASNTTGLSTEDEFDEFEAKETTAQLRTYLFGQQNAPDWKIYCSPTKFKTGLGTVAIKPEAQFKAGRLSYLYIAAALYYGQMNGEIYEPLFIDDLQIMLTGTTWTDEIETIVLEIPDPEDPDAAPEIEVRENRHFDPTEDGEGDPDEAAIRLLAMLGGGDSSFGAAYVDQYIAALGLMNTTMGSIGDLSDAYTTAKDLAVFYKDLFNNSILDNESLVPLKELINRHENVVGVGEKSCTLLFSDSTDQYEIVACILNPNGSPTALVLQVEGPGLKLDHEAAASFKETILTALANRKE